MANEFQMFMIEFHGKAQYLNEEIEDNDIGRQNNKRLRKDIEKINDHSLEIASDIQRELKRVLPVSINIQAQIIFEEGSITWSGVILLVQAMGMAVDFVGFTVIIKKLAEISVDRVVRHWVYKNVEQPVQFSEPTQIIIINQPAQTQTREENAQFRMARLLVYNTIILAVLFFIQLIPFFQSMIAFLQANKP